MLAPTNAKLAKRLRDAAVDAAWVQWHALGGQVAERHPASIVDPEALIMVTAAFAAQEPRLRDMLAGFAHADTGRVSVQRLRRIAPGFPPRVQHAVGRLAKSVALAGDRSWSKLARGHPLDAGRPGKVRSAESRLLEEGSLMLRMRAAFGMDVRADVLTFLLGNQGAPFDVREIRAQLAYATNSISGACESLREAGVVIARSERPVEYGLKLSRWQGFLGISVPSWRPWYALYSIAVNLHDWLVEHQNRVMSKDVNQMLTAEWLASHKEAALLIEIDAETVKNFVDLAEVLAHHLEMGA